MSSIFSPGGSNTVVHTAPEQPKDMDRSSMDEQGLLLAAAETSPGMAADAACVAAVLRGETQRFEELVLRHQDAVFAAVCAYRVNAHQAEDICQDVFLKAFTSLNTLRDPRCFGPWLTGIARNLIRNSLRAARASVPLTETAAPCPPDENPVQKQARVLAVVEELEEPYRTTVLLKYRQGLSCREIAQQEGVALATVTSRLSRALSQLRGILRE